MTGSRLLVGLASVFVGIAVAMAVAASAYQTPVPLAIAFPAGITGYLLWYQGTGRLAARMRTRVQRTSRTRRRTRGRQTQQGRRHTPRGGRSGPTRKEAYSTLGLDPSSGKREIKRAYREKVKATHPDRGGDEEAFKEVTNAYERLTD